MNLNNDLSLRVVLRSTELPWQPSPVTSVQRRLLARDGGEDARATSIVRYAPGAKFSSPAHPRGEEILVLQGTFQEEYGSYPSGTWIRSPHMCSRQPYSESGCLIFVKVGHLP
jgi:anti-sigma factor ChrR (cupin superfamily)